MAFSLPASALLVHTTASMQAHGDCDQRYPESADSGPAIEFPSEARARRADRSAHKHSAHEDRIQPVTRLRSKGIDDVLVRDQRTLLAEVQQNDADDQAGDRAPHLKNRPGRKHNHAAKSDDGMGTSPVCDLPADGRK